MSGAKLFEITVGSESLAAALREISRHASNLDPALADIGEYLLNSHRARFRREVEPDGTPWLPLSPKYKRVKAKNKGKILRLDGHLQRLLRYQVSGGELVFGTNRIYGAVHQFGFEEHGIPARPFLGISDEDESEVVQILISHVTPD